MTSENAEASTNGRSHGKAAIQPNGPRPPRRRPAISSEAQIGENREQRWYRDHSGEHGMEKLEARTDLGIGKQMMNADRHREDQELQERDAAHLVAVQAAAGGLRQQYVERDIGGYQPEVDDGMKVQENSSRASPGSIVAVQPKALGRIRNTISAPDPERCPSPEQCAGRRGKHRQRNRQAGMIASSSA